MPQSSYTQGPATAAFPGQKTNSGASTVATYTNGQGVDIPAGVLVSLTSDNTVQLPSTATQQLAGVVLNQFARDPNDMTLTNAVKAGYSCAVLENGDVWVTAEQAMAVTDKVFVRYAAGAGGTQLGAIRKDIDTASARRASGARVRVGCSGAGPCLISFSAAADASNL